MEKYEELINDCSYWSLASTLPLEMRSIMCNGAEENPKVKIKCPKGLETTSIYGLPPSLLFLLLCTQFHRSKNSSDGVDKKKWLFLNPLATRITTACLFFLETR